MSVHACSPVLCPYLFSSTCTVQSDKILLAYTYKICWLSEQVLQSMVTPEAVVQGNAAAAQGVLIRLLQIGFATGSIVALGILLLQVPALA